MEEVLIRAASALGMDGSPLYAHSAMLVLVLHTIEWENLFLLLVPVKKLKNFYHQYVHVR